MYFVVANQVAHVQWFNHGSKTFLGELANPQELFLADHCDTVKFNDIVAKVEVHFAPALPPPDKPDHFVCKYALLILRREILLKGYGIDSCTPLV
jgi:DNA (cytosine-5)-methyltransferase 1